MSIYIITTDYDTEDIEKLIASELPNIEAKVEKVDEFGEAAVIYVDCKDDILQDVNDLLAGDVGIIITEAWEKPAKTILSVDESDVLYFLTGSSDDENATESQLEYIGDLDLSDIRGKAQDYLSELGVYVDAMNYALDELGIKDEFENLFGEEEFEDEDDSADEVGG